jgi:membrane protein DedA with SNARE-associated domain
MMPFILFTAGSSGIRFSQYIALNAIGEVGWTGILMVLGYFYSSTISSIENVVGKFFFLVGSLVVLSVFIYATKVIFRKFFIIAK